MIKNASREEVAKEKTGLTWFQRFGLFFYDKREGTFVYWVALLIFGVLCYTTFMKRQGFPNVDVPISVVNGTYFVNDRAKVDSEVTKPASEAIGRIPEVKAVTSQAGDNFFVMQVEFKEGTSSAGGTEKVRSALSRPGQLPKAAQLEYKPIDAAKYAEQSDLLLTVYGTPKTDIRKLEARARTIAAELATRDGVARTVELKQFETGVNPATGKSTTQQRNFDRIGVREDGKTVLYPAVTIGVAAKANKDAVHLSHDMQKIVEELQRDPANKDLKFRVSADLAEGIETQISGLQESLLEGLAAVLLVCFLLISFRASLTTAIAMVTVLLITIAIMYATGNTLNTVTLFALILSLGLIVDDTIIKVEAIDVAKHESRSKRDILAAANRRVARASTSGTLTTMLAFAPMLFVSGVLGEFIRVLPVTIIVSLAVSLLISLTLVPVLAAKIILRKQPKPSRNPVHRLESLISGTLARLLLVGKRSRLKGGLIGAVALLISVGMIVGSLFYFQKLRFDIFPATKDSDIISVNLQFTPGTTIHQAQAIAARADQKVAQTLGANLTRISYQNSGSDMMATATVSLVSFKDRDPSSPQLISQLNQAFKGFGGAIVKVNQIDVGPPKEDLPFRVQIQNEDASRATRLANDMVTYLQDRKVTRINGTEATVTRAEIGLPTQIVRNDANRVVEVRAGFDADDVSALVTAAQNSVEDRFTTERLRGYGINPDQLIFDFGSESENQESFKTMLIAFPVLLIIMYLLMAVQFKSFLQPLLIFAAIPYSFFGVAYGLHLTDNPLSFFVMVGFFALIGIALNNTILLTDYANQARAEGMGRIDAVATAVRARFRPLITTSLTSVVALVPLALSDPFWESLSYTLIFGLLSSTFLVVVAFPYLYLAGEVLRIFGHKLWSRQLPVMVQYPLDLLIAPARILAFLLHIIFRYQTKESTGSA